MSDTGCVQQHKCCELSEKLSAMNTLISADSNLSEMLTQNINDQLKKKDN